MTQEPDLADIARRAGAFHQGRSRPAQATSESAPLRRQMGEEAIIGGLIAGSAPLATQLFRSQKPKVRGVLLRILGPVPHLEDLVQEVFIGVFRGLTTFRGDASLSTWIEACAKRIAFGHIRHERARRRLEYPGWHGPTEAPSHEQQVLAREAIECLLQALEPLGARSREAFLAHVLDGRSVIEIANAMRSTISATRVRIWRARRYIETRAHGDGPLAAYVASRTARLGRPLRKAKDGRTI